MFTLVAFAGSIVAAIFSEESARGVPVLRTDDGSGEPPPEPETPRLEPESPQAQAIIVEVSEKYLPHVVAEIAEAKEDEPQITESWKAIARRIPYLTESIAMFYAMEDPETPNEPKIAMAVALAYTISPFDIIPDWMPGVGGVDDVGVISSALYNVYTYIEPRHLDQAREWLESHGVEPKPLFSLGKKFERELTDSMRESE